VNLIDRDALDEGELESARRRRPFGRGVVLTPDRGIDPPLDRTRAGELTVGELRAGRYLVRVLPNADGKASGLAAYVLDGELEVALAAGGRTEIAWTPELGGRLRFNVFGPAEARGPGVTLSDAAGTVLALDLDEERGRRSGARTLPRGESEIAYALPAGAYALRLEPRGKQPRDLSIAIRADETTELAIDLAGL
jgi:hypothetical protein